MVLTMRRKIMSMKLLMTGMMMVQVLGDPTVEVFASRDVDSFSLFGTNVLLQSTSSVDTNARVCLRPNRDSAKSNLTLSRGLALKRL